MITDVKKWHYLSVTKIIYITQRNKIMKKINHILIEKFVIYVKNNLLLILVIEVNIY